MDETNPFEPTETNNLLTAGGFLSKVADTALDVWALRETQKTVGSVYPTGQVNPAAAQAVNASTKPPFNYTPYVIAGGALVAVVIIIAALRK